MDKYHLKNIENSVKKKILIIMACDITMGGVSIFIRNMLCNMNLSEFCIHIYTPKQILSQSIADELMNLGIVLYTGGCGESDFLREKAWEDLEQLMDFAHYDVIHCNSGKVWINYYSCYFGIKYNVPKRIVHSHSALLPRKNPMVQKQDDKYREYIRSNATDFLACSRMAAKWLYGSGFTNYLIMKNGIETERYNFNESIRKKYRKKLGIEEKFVIGHVGRFVEAKNHTFLLEIFKEISLMCDKSILFMVGEGELLNKMKEWAKIKGLEKKCLFLGNRSDVPELLNVMDIFLFPSLFEGFPISILEAQTNGLPCIISKNISEEVCVTNLVKMVSLDESAEYWASIVMKQLYENDTRKSYISKIETAGYSIKNSADKLYQLYI